MKTLQDTFKVLDIDGREAVVLIPDLKQEKMAVISQNLLERLVDILPNVSFNELKINIIASIEDAKDMNELMTVLTDEVDFHYSVRNCREYFGFEEEVEVTVANH